MKRLLIFIILTYIGACSCNVTGIEQKILEEKQNKISVLINGKQWLDYFKGEEIRGSYQSSLLRYSSIDTNQAYLLITWTFDLTNKFREYIFVGFVFLRSFDFDTLKTPIEVDYLSDAVGYPQELGYIESDYDVRIGVWERYDSTRIAKATITYFNYAERIVEVTFEGTIILNKHMVENPYPGRLWPDTLHITDGLIRSKFRDVRIGE